MSDRQTRGPRLSRLSSAAPRAAVRVRMLSTGRWRPPLGPTPLVGRRAPRVIAVGAALPGVGKSVVASNLAVAIGGLGRQVALIDLDVGAPRQHALFGVSPPAELERPTGVRNVKLWPAAAALGGVHDEEARRAVIEGFSRLDADVVIVDVGQPARDDLWNFFATGAERLLVSTGDRAALAATFAFLKEAALRAERRHGPAARTMLERFSGGLIGNAGAGGEEAEVFHAFARLVRGELGIPLTALGCLRKSARIAESVAAGRPLCARRGMDDEVRAFHQLAESLLAEHAGAPATCALDGERPVGGSGRAADLPADLPAALGRYQRRHPRVVVDWAATLEINGEPNAVRICDVSESGAAIETMLPLKPGDTGLLHFYQLDDDLSIPVTVKNVIPSLNRVGLAFARGGSGPARVVREARARLIAS
jgi:MinD-like ATPase involved in chromosome partitioning or flagellar assembly